MSIPAKIERSGFRKWYERELIRGHSHLVLLLLCTLGLLGALEAFSEARGIDRLLLALSFAIAGLVGAWSLRRYLFHLMRAESVANQADCPACKVYARWRVEQAVPAGGNVDEGTMDVCCRNCGHRWRIDL
jgi:ABC-type nickel/cobalt efflux system permease component RcnA